MTISSIKIQAGFSAPGCHSGQLSIFFAWIRMNWISWATSALKSRMVGSYSFRGISWVSCSIFLKRLPSFEIENETNFGNQIQLPAFCRKVAVTDCISLTFPKSIVASRSGPNHPCQAPQAVGIQGGIQGGISPYPPESPLEGGNFGLHVWLVAYFKMALKMV